MILKTLRITETIFAFALVVLLILLFLYSCERGHDRPGNLLHPGKGNDQMKLLMDSGSRIKTDNPAKAIHYFTQALKIADSLGDQEHQANILIEITDSYERLKRYDSVLIFGDRAYVLNRNISNTTGVINALSFVGMAQNLLGKRKEALATLNQALQFLDQMKEKKPGDSACNYLLGRVLNNIGTVYILDYKYTEALRYFLGLEKKYGDRNPKILLSVKGNLGYLYRKTGKYDSSIICLNGAMVIAKALKDQEMVSQTLTELGNTYYSSGMYLDALAYFSQALEMEKEQDNQKGIAQNLNNLAVVNKELGNYSQAVDYFSRTLEIKEKLGDKQGLAIILNNLGTVFSEWKNPGKAKSYYLRSLALNRELGNKAMEAMNYVNLGNILQGQNQRDSALIMYDKSLDIMTGTGNKNGSLGSLIGLGDVYSGRAEDIPKAMKYYMEALDIAGSIKAEYYKAEVEIKLGKLFLAAGKVSEAKNYTVRAYNYAQAENNKEQMKECFLQLSEMEEKSGNLPKSMDYYKKYTLLKDSIFNETNSRQIVEMQTKYETAKKEKENIELRKNDEIQYLKIARQRITIVFLGCGIFFVMVAFVIFLLLNRSRIRALKNLVRKNLDIVKAEKEVSEKEDLLANNRRQGSRPGDDACRYGQLVSRPA